MLKGENGVGAPHSIMAMDEVSLYLHLLGNGA
jgi:hypothetical protein